MIPYVVLFCHFIEYFEIDTKGEVVELVKAQNEISAATLSKIGQTKVNGDHWICKADYNSPDHQAVEEGEGASTSTVVAAATREAMMLPCLMFHPLDMKIILLDLKRE